MSFTVAVGSIFIECNHFGGAPADLETFRRSELFHGQDVLDRRAGTVGGMLSTLREQGADIRPLLVASGCPSGPVTEECHATLKDDLLSRLDAAGPVDGVLLALHGSAAVDGGLHLESDLLSAVRARVGSTVPLVVTLDLHAHVTREMVHSADAILAWETYPHRDAWETGCRGARALHAILTGALRPAMAMAKVPVLVSGVFGHTDGAGPFADVMRLAKSFERLPGVFSTSAFLVHPYLDFPEMGGGGLVIVNGDADLAANLATKIASAYWDRRRDLEPETWTPCEAIHHGLAIQGGPVLLVETADCCGGGAAGDSVASLRALLELAPDQPSAVLVVDPEAAAACHRAGPGSRVALEIGHRIDPQWGRPLAVSGIVSSACDGGFTYRGGIWDGQPGRMGPSAVLQCDGIRVCLASHPTYEWCGEQFDLLGIRVPELKFLVVKNPMNFRMVHSPLARATLILDTPGPTPATLRGRTFHNLRRPYFPADPEIPGLAPSVVRHASGEH